MSSSIPLIAPSPPQLPLRRHLELLEQRCTELWAHEPLTPDGRERALARLSEIEHRVVGLILKSLATPDDPSLRTGAEGCQQDLQRLGTLWAGPRAA